MMDINVSGVWRCCKAVIPHLRANGGGSIINIASLAAVFGIPNALHYATLKAAVIGMTRSMARQLGRSWIRVNVIAPSAVMTEETEEVFGKRLEKAKQVIACRQSMRRNLGTEDLVGTVRYLLSDEYKSVTGQTIMVDGRALFLSSDILSGSADDAPRNPGRYYRTTVRASGCGHDCYVR